MNSSTKTSCSLSRPFQRPSSIRMRECFTIEDHDGGLYYVNTSHGRMDLEEAFKRAESPQSSPRCDSWAVETARLFHLGPEKPFQIPLILSLHGKLCK